MAPATRRIELSDGNWAIIRANLTIGDLKRQRKVAHDRGWTDDVMDGVDLIQYAIVEWSFGPVNEETIDALTFADTTKIGEVIRKMGEAPAPQSENLSDGGK